jgi:c-di-GMP-binding flagellar brake protein YcgR
MVKQMTEDRRAGIRAKRILSIQYRLQKTKSKLRDKNWYLSTTQDMSYSGLAFLSEHAYTPGDVLELKVVMSGVLDIYSGLAKVVRTERNASAAYYLVAVKFVNGKTRKAKSYTSGKNRIARVARKK